MHGTMPAARRSASDQESSTSDAAHPPFRCRNRRRSGGSQAILQALDRFRRKHILRKILVRVRIAYDRSCSQSVARLIFPTTSLSEKFLHGIQFILEQEPGSIEAGFNGPDRQR